MRSLVFLTLIFAFSSAVFAGDKIGNGGGVWACGSSQSEVSSAMLVDLYEAREEFGLNTLSSSDTNPFNIVQSRADFLKSEWPEMFQAWDSILGTVNSTIRFVSSELVVVDDSLYRIKPSPLTCSGKWKYMQFANFTYQNQVLIQKELWNGSAVPSVDKAALIWHEVIYKWLRETYGDKDSVRARQIVGILFSDLDVMEMKLRVQNVLAQLPQPGPNPEPQPPPLPEAEKWTCITRNANTFFWFVGLGSTELEAQLTSKTNCESAENGFFCNDMRLGCEENTSAIPKHVCSVVDGLSFKTFVGKGRSVLEAKFNAFNACSATVDPVHCNVKECQ